jgi:hypothetical protein
MTRYFPAISSRGMLVIPLLPGNLRGEIFTGTPFSLIAFNVVPSWLK